MITIVHDKSDKFSRLVNILDGYKNIFPPFFRNNNVRGQKSFCRINGVDVYSDFYHNSLLKWGLKGLVKLGYIGYIIITVKNKLM